MDVTLYFTIVKIVVFFEIVYVKGDLTDCHPGNKYIPCVCSVRPDIPPNGNIFYNMVQGRYVCNKGYVLAVYAIIRCLQGERSNYWNTTENACRAIALGDTCGSDSDCAGVTNANCNIICVCEGQYKNDRATCVSKTLGDTCGSDSDCAGVTNANCNTICVCEGQYKNDRATCVSKTLGDTCGSDSDCAGVTNANCNTSCVCEGQYKRDGATCILKGTPSVTTYSTMSQTETTKSNSNFQTEQSSINPSTKTSTSHSPISLTSEIASSMSAKPSVTTYTTMSQTETTTSSSNVQTEQSSINPSTKTSTSHSPISLSSQNASSMQDINAAYIAVPVVVFVIALFIGFGILWWRRRTTKPAALFERSEPGSLITNQVYGASGIDRHCSLINVRQSTVNEYAEIPLDIMNSDGTTGDIYQTIDILPEDKADVKKSYDNFKLSETEFIDTNYSHIGLNNTRNNTHADNTYSHTQLGPQKPEITIGVDDTYNKLNTTTLSNRRGQSIENSDTEYNHAQAGSQDHKIEADNYSHLNTNMRTQGESTTKMPHQQNEDNNKNSNIRQLSAKDLQSNTSYEFANDFDNLKHSSEIKMPKQDDARKNKNSNNYAQDLTPKTGYEFAKDFDYMQNRSEAPKYAKVTKKKPAVSKADNAGKGYETAVGTKHNYLILEPEQNPAPTAALFNVVEDVSTEIDEIPEAETGHEYFTLEKQDM